MIALDRIHVPANVRQLDGEHVKALAASIALQGMLVPIVVCPAHEEVAATGFERELAAGFQRHAAALELGLAEISAVVRQAEQEASARATRLHWESHEGIAVKALEKLAEPYLPVSLKAARKRDQAGPARQGATKRRAPKRWRNGCQRLGHYRRAGRDDHDQLEAEPLLEDELDDDELQDAA